MKESYMRCFIVIIFSIFLMQCSSTQYPAPDNISNIVGEIFAEPSRLRELDRYFPEIYADSLLDPKMKNQEYIEKLIQYIQKEYSNPLQKTNSIFFPISISKIDLLFRFDSTAIIHKYDLKDIFIQKYLIESQMAHLTFYWIRIQSKYYLYTITYGYPYWK